MRVFAEKFELRRTRDECSETIIRGKFGHIYKYDSSRIGLVLLEPAAKPSRAKLYLAKRRITLRAGFVLTQAGATESVLLFNRDDDEKCKLAVRLVKAKRRRRHRMASGSLANLGPASTQKALQSLEPTISAIHDARGLSAVSTPLLGSEVGISSQAPFCRQGGPNENALDDCRRWPQSNWQVLDGVENSTR